MSRNRHFITTQLALVIAGALLVGPGWGRSHSPQDKIQSPARLNVTLTPKFLVLGRDAKATVKIHVSQETEDLVLDVNVGQISNLHRAGPKLYVADFIPPHATIPRVALLNAVAQSPSGMAHGWARLPLWGQGDAVVKTRPHSAVSISVANKRFGPGWSNAEGIALIPIIVPPGVDTGIAEKKTIDLGLPEVSQLLLSLDQKQARADQDQSIGLRALLVSKDGRPRSGATIDLKPSRGQSSQMREFAPGLYLAQWSLAAGPSGLVEINAQVLGEPTQRSSTQLRVSPGPANKITLQTARPTFVAGEKELVVSAQILDAAGNPVSDALAWTCNICQLVEAQEQQMGSYLARFSLPNYFSDVEKLAIRADIKDLEITTQLSLPLAPAVPQRIEMTAAELNPIAAEGQRELKIYVRDRFGNLTEADNLSLQVDQGSLSPVREPSPKNYLATYRAPAYPQNDHATVVVHLDAIEQRLQIPLQTRPRWLQLQAKAGLLSDAGQVHTGYVATQAIAWTPIFYNDFGLGLELGYFPILRHYQDPRWFAEQTIQASNHFLLLPVTLGWRHEIAPNWPFWLGLGGGPGMLWSQLEVPSQPMQSEFTVLWAMQASAGLGWRLGMGGPFVEARYSWFSDPQLSSVRGALPALLLLAGYMLEL